MKNIILCGFMGSGKTTVGKKLATSLNMRFVDTDSLLEKKENMSIPEIFEQHGEAYFRTKEAELCEYLSGLTNTVIATGGGFAVNDAIIPQINKLGTVVYLDVSDKTVLKRVFADPNRPLVASKSAQEIITLYNSRKKKYSAVANITVNGELSKKQVVQSIKDNLSSL